MTLVANLVEQPGGLWIHSSIVGFARSAGTGNYDAGDVVSDSDSVAAALAFPQCGRSGQLRDAMIVVTGDAPTGNGNEDLFRLYLFTREPTNHVDGGALVLAQSDVDALRGVVSFTDDGIEHGGAVVYRAAGGATFPFPRTLDSSLLYGLLVVGPKKWNNPDAGQRINVSLGIEPDRAGG